MCGRYFLQDDDEVAEINHIIDMIDEKYSSFEGSKQLKKGEIFPTDTSPLLIAEKDVILAEKGTWGFPYPDGKKGVIINARSETAHQKRMFSESLMLRRCIIPSTGFFEWSHDGNKTKYLFRLPDEKALYMAGIYYYSQSGRRFVILTAPANGSMSDIHDRMPVVLPKNMCERWLFSRSDALSYLSSELPMLEKNAV